MYGYIYKTTNLINGKIYIGQKHSDKFLGNTYLGSGKELRKSIIKYGKSNFKVELIEEVETKELMDEREIYWISYYHSTNKEIGYNLSEGGNVNRTLVGENNPFYGKHHTMESKKKNSDSCKGRIPWNNGLTKETDERVKKYVLNNNNRGKTKDTVWINNGTVSKMIKKEYIEGYLNKNWKLGRLPLPKDSYKGITLGRIRINNGIIERNIKEEELDSYLSNGWVRGRLKFKDTSKFGKHMTKSIICLETNCIYTSVKEASEQLKISSSSISRSCKKDTYTAGGYHWKYLD